MTDQRKTPLTDMFSAQRPDPRPCSSCGVIMQPRYIAPMGVWAPHSVACDACLIADEEHQRRDGIVGATNDYLTRAGVKARHLARMNKLIADGVIDAPGLDGVLMGVLADVGDPLAEHWAWIVGEPGTGKTTQLMLLARAVVAAAIESGKTPPRVRYTTELEMTMDFKNFDMPREKVITKYSTPKLLLVDEAGRGRGTPHEYGLWWSIMDARYSAGLATVFASNYVVEAEDGVDCPFDVVPNRAFYDEPMVGRIMEMMANGRNIVALLRDVRFGGVQ